MKLKLPFDVGDDEVQMAPMIDMVFLLLIFFMVASHINQLERVDIEVPIAENAKVAKEFVDRRNVTITAEGNIYLGTALTPLEEVKPKIEKEMQQIKGLRIFLRADKTVAHRKVREVMNACAEAGAVDIIFATFESDL
jgi:biopolymer transport protein ExbD